MPSQNNNGGPWGQGPNAAPDFEDVLRRAQDSLRQIMPGGGPLGLLVLAVLGSGGLGRMDGLLHRAERLGGGGAALRQISEGGPAWPAFQAAARDRCRDHRAGQTSVEAGIRVHHARRHRSVSEPKRRQEGNRDGDRRPERRTGRMGGSVSHLGSGQLSVRGQGTERDAALCLGIRHARSGRRSHGRRGHHHRDDRKSRPRR